MFCWVVSVNRSLWYVWAPGLWSDRGTADLSAIIAYLFYSITGSTQMRIRRYFCGTGDEEKNVCEKWLMRGKVRSHSTSALHNSSTQTWVPSVNSIEGNKTIFPIILWMFDNNNIAKRNVVTYKSNSIFPNYYNF